MAALHRVSLEGQTAYAELLSDLMRYAHAETPGSIARKRVGGRDYLYVQRRTLGHMHQAYLGPDTEEIRSRVRELEAAWQAQHVREDRRARLVRVARAAGVATPTAAEAKVLRALAEARLFEVGGVLAGTHAFAVIGNALGAAWEGGALRTGDIDLVHDPRIAVAMSNHPPAALARMQTEGVLGVKLWAIPGLDPREPSCSFMVYGTELHVDFLTPLRGRSEKPVHLSIVGGAAQPLRFLDYLVEETMPAVVVGGSGVLVNVPTPARFALHKLIVATLRSPSLATKERKDLLQAESLLAFLLEDRPDDVREAWRALSARGPGWIKRVRASLRKLDPSIGPRIDRVVAAS